MTWIEAAGQADLDRLMDTFGGFHDGCIREMHLWTGTYVDTGLSMSCPPGLDNHVRLLVQRQWKNPSAVELLFDGVQGVNIAPSPDNYDSIIFEATLLLKEGTFYWADVASWLPDQEDCGNATWIAASKLKWRDASEWMGGELRYGPRDAAAGN